MTIKTMRRVVEALRALPNVLIPTGEEQRTHDLADVVEQELGTQPMSTLLGTAPSNADRADWAQTAVDAFDALGGTDEDDLIPDLITNLCHLQRRKCEERGEEFDASVFLMARAQMHDMEVAEDEEE